jgi:hypothetical protein
MWAQLFEFFKGLFDGKGSTQIGAGNVNVSAGQNASNINLRDINIRLPQMPMPPAVYEPRPDEVEILVRLAASHSKTLQLAPTDFPSGSAVLIDDKAVADVRDTESCLRSLEAVQRLRENKLLIDPQGDGLLHLSSEGRTISSRLEADKRKCPGCGRSMENVGTDPRQPPTWACTNSRCLRSIGHRSAKCPTCGKAPVEITDGGVGFTDFLCADGHRFTTTPTINEATKSG